MKFITRFVLLSAEIKVFWLLHWLLFAGCTMGFQKVAELDSQRVQQSTCLDNREWIL
jgi:hypothetical protein